MITKINISTGPIFSIVVPVYNVEKYLERCIESILNQTFGDFELILVNDGSSDNSLSICYKYKRIDKRIRIVSQKNAGVSAARNRGIEIAKGKLLVFVDSDDYIAKDMLKKINCEWQYYHSQFISATKKWRLLRKKVINKNSNWFLEYLVNVYSYAVYSKAFQLDIINKNNIRFDTSLKACEDALFIREYLCYCDRLSFIPYKYYFYNTDNSDSLSKKGYLEYSEYFLKKLMILEKLMNSTNFSSEKKKKFISYRAVHGIYVSSEHYNRNFNDKEDKLIKRAVSMLSPYIIDSSSLHEYKRLYKYTLYPIIDNGVESVDSIKKYLNETNIYKIF